jgi:hypothetical protein
MSKVEEWEEAKKARNKWLEVMFSGIIGLFSVIASMPSFDPLMTRFGAYTAFLVAYLVFLGVCLFKVIEYQKKMNKISHQLHAHA